MWTWWLPSLYFRMYDAYEKETARDDTRLLRGQQCPTLTAQENIDGRTFKQYLTYHFNYWMASGRGRSDVVVYSLEIQVAQVASLVKLQGCGLWAFRWDLCDVSTSGHWHPDTVDLGFRAQLLSALLLLVQLFLSEMAPLSATKVLSFMPS